MTDVGKTTVLAIFFLTLPFVSEANAKQVIVNCTALLGTDKVSFTYKIDTNKKTVYSTNLERNLEIKRFDEDFIVAVIEQPGEEKLSFVINIDRLSGAYLKRMSPPSAGRKETFDAKVPGLFLRVTKTSNKSWGLDFRVNGKRERLMLGSYPVVGLDEARTAGMDALRAVRDGRNPAAEKRAAKENKLSPDTFRAVAALFVNRHAKRNNRSWKETERIFKVYVAPV